MRLIYLSLFLLVYISGVAQDAEIDKELALEDMSLLDCKLTDINISQQKTDILCQVATFLNEKGFIKLNVGVVTVLSPT